MIIEFMERHKLITSISLIWIFWLITWVTMQIFSKPVDIPMGTATAYASLLGIPAIVIGLYKWRRETGK